MRKLLSTIAGVIALAAMPAAAPADIVVLVDGTRLEGRVEPGGSRDRITFISGAGQLELPASRIQEIIEEDDAMDWTRVGNQYLNARRYQTAIQMYQLALEADPDFELAREGLAQARAAVEEAQSERQRQAMESLGRELENVPALIENEAYAEAQGILERVLNASTSEEQIALAQRQMRELYLAWGFSRYDRLDYRGAEEKYLRVLEMDPDNERARDRLLVIWQRDPSKKPEVLEAYQHKLQSEPDNLEYNRIVGDILYDFERYEEALPHLKKLAGVTRYAGMGYNQKLRRTFEEAIREAGDRDELPRAIELYQEMLTLYPNADPTPLIVLRYEQDRRRLEEGDYRGWAQLVSRLFDAGLIEYGTREAEMILRYDPENERAIELLRNEAETRLRRIEQTIREGNYIVARDMALRFVENEKRFADLVETAHEYYNRSDIEARREARATRERATEIAQRGIEYYNEAMNLVTLMNRQDVRTDIRPISYKQQATDRAVRSISHFETALRLDPALGGIEGMDLTSRLRDARALYRGLTDRPAPLPTIRQRSPIVPE